jgi:hypothetical protein
MINKLKNKVAFQISVGITLILVLLVAIGIVVISSMRHLSSITTDIYKHPFMVNNSALMVRFNIEHMRDHMLDIALSKGSNRAESLGAELAALESSARDNFKELETNFVGDPAKVAETSRLLNDWREARIRIVDLAKLGQWNQVINVVSNANSITFVQHCPECMRSDKKPYYRKLWRYAFYTICPTHQIPLRSTCPHCGKSYCNLLSYVQKNIDLNQPLTACWSCGMNICDVEQPLKWGGDLLEQALAIQSNILSAVNQGSIDIPSYGYVYSRSYLDALYGVLRTLIEWRQAEARMSYVSRMSGVEFRGHVTEQDKYFGLSEFESGSAQDRAIILCLANWLMGDWPKRVMAYVEKCNISRNEVFQPNDESYWLNTSVLQLLKQKSADGHTKEEIESATLILRARMKRPVTDSEVKEFVTTGTLADHTAERMAKRIAGRKAVQAMHQKFSKEWANQRQAEKNRRLAKIITRSESKKFMEKFRKDQKPAQAKPRSEVDNLDS